MYDSIVVPFDASEPAEAAAETAVRVADIVDAEVSILAVAEPSHYPRTGVVSDDPLPDDPDREDLGTHWVQAIGRVEAAAADAGVSSRTTIEMGAPHERIEAHVDRVGADLVAMGTHGRTGLDRLLLGSVTERALRTLDVPVLAVPGPDAVAAADDVLVPTDGSAGSERAAEHACALADACDATVHGLAVVDVQSMATGGTGAIAVPDIVDALEEQRSNDVERVGEHADAYGLDFESRVMEGTAERAISDYARERDVDLIAMGTHGREGVRRFFLGSVTERTVRDGVAPVLAIPIAE